MADIRGVMKNAMLKTMEAINRTANSIATSTKTKVDEMNMVNRRQEILASFGTKAYELWQKGEQFPEELEALLKELADVDTELESLRKERLAKAAKPVTEPVKEAEAAVEKAAEETVEAVGETIDDAIESVEELIEEIHEDTDTAQTDDDEDDAPKYTAE